MIKLRMILFLFVGVCVSECVVFAIGTGPKWKITLRVIDQDGIPVEGAVAYAGYGLPAGAHGEIRGELLEERTDSSGEATFSAKSYHPPRLGARKDSYYPSSIRDYQFNTTRLRRWMPWNPTVEIELKEIRSPVPMYAKSVNIGVPLNIPEVGVSLGYDMEKGEWLPPHGKGEVSDFVFTGILEQHDERNYDYTLTVSFSNKGDGIVEGGLQSKQSSEFKSDHKAPKDGYLDEWIIYERVPPGGYRETNRDEDRIYYFRVRTELDNSGNVIGAKYGKIYGDFFRFIHYFNPDGTRNMEFDPDKNLVPADEVYVGPGMGQPRP